MGVLYIYIYLNFLKRIFIYEMCIVDFVKRCGHSFIKYIWFFQKVENFWTNPLKALASIRFRLKRKLDTNWTGRTG
jgi:hypothetical protein